MKITFALLPTQLVMKRSFAVLISHAPQKGHNVRTVALSNSSIHLTAGKRALTEKCRGNICVGKCNNDICVGKCNQAYRTHKRTVLLTRKQQSILSLCLNFFPVSSESLTAALFSHWNENGTVVSSTNGKC